MGFIGMMGASLATSAIAGAVLALPAAAFYRRFRREGLRRKLACLPREEQAAVLLPLEHEGRLDTRAIVAHAASPIRSPGPRDAARPFAAGNGREA